LVWESGAHEIAQLVVGNAPADIPAFALNDDPFCPVICNQVDPMIPGAAYEFNFITKSLEEPPHKFLKLPARQPIKRLQGLQFRVAEMRPYPLHLSRDLRLRGGPSFLSAPYFGFLIPAFCQP